MKKNLKTFIVGALFVVLVLVAYHYISNRDETTDATDDAVSDQLVAELTTKDIEANYPQSPRELIKLYVKITTAYYQTDLTEEQIEQLGTQARLLFDDELLATQTDEEFLDALKEDIAEYQAADRYISESQIQSSTEVNYTTFNGQKYASIIAMYYIREGSNLTTTYTKFVMRKDDQGHWKILYWELADVDDIS